MTDQRHKKLIMDGDKLFSDRKELDSLWQEIALNFYPEMAEFTSTRSRGQDFADHLTTSFPLIARRSLGDALSALLRPVNLDTTSPGIWFEVRTDQPADQEDNEAKRWLERATGIQRRAVYDRKANFVRATKEGDHSFVTFGQTPITVELTPDRDSLLYRNWHLRDVVWSEDATSQIDHVQRRWNPTASELASAFRDKIAPQVKEKLSDAPFARVNIRHIVIATENYERRDAEGKKFNTPWVSIWLDVDNDHVMEEVGSVTKIYVIPRWVTVPGSQYASSPAVMAALPDARLIQAMTLTLLEASEKFADPPIIATQEAVRSDINLYAGGHTWVDAEYDERLGEAIRPLFQPQAGQGAALGLEMRADVREMLSKAFFLDSLSLPPAQLGDMTAFEVGERISEWIRRAMPIFEPMEFEYNGALMEETFELLQVNGAFGSPQDMPASLSNANVRFKFQSPIHESAERRKGQKFLEAKEALAQAVEIDPSSRHLMDARTALRAVFEGIGVPAEWQRSERDVEELAQADAEAEQTEQALVQTGAAATAARDLGAAVKDVSAAGPVPAI